MRDTSKIHFVAVEIDYVGLDYMSLDDAIVKLTQLREQYGKTHTNLRLEPSSYSEGSLYLLGDRPETADEAKKRELKAAQTELAQRQQYERLKKQFGD